MLNAHRLALLACVALAAPSLTTPAFAADPIKVPLKTTPLTTPSYLFPATYFAKPPTTPPPGVFTLPLKKPTAEFTLAGLACTLTSEAKPDPNKQGAAAKVILKTPTQTMDLASGQPLKLDLDGGRIYFLNNLGSYAFGEGDDFMTHVNLRPGATQEGTLDQAPIAFYDSNFDGFYTADDAVRIGPTAAPAQGLPFELLQPYSKFLGTSARIFEIQSLAKDGSELVCLPYTGPTGTLAVVGPKGYSVRLVLTSSDAEVKLTL